MFSITYTPLKNRLRHKFLLHHRWHRQSLYRSPPRIGNVPKIARSIRETRAGKAEEKPVKQVELAALLAAPEGFGDDVPVDPNFHARRLPDRVWRHSNRNAIRDASESVSDSELEELWRRVQIELGSLRLFGDFVLAAYFEGEKPKG